LFISKRALSMIAKRESTRNPVEQQVKLDELYKICYTPSSFETVLPCAWRGGEPYKNAFRCAREAQEVRLARAKRGSAQP
jgi:hypothetical protein